MRDYNIIGHIHGKRSLAVNATMGERWREFLWQNLIGDAQPMIDIIIERFATDGRTGIVFPNDSHLCDWDQNRDVVKDLARPMGIKVPLPPFFEFPIGTMFWARVDALRPLFKLKISRDDCARRRDDPARARAVAAVRGAARRLPARRNPRAGRDLVEEDVRLGSRRCKSSYFR
jgi:lipopolysaccharide biosynthesis protein